MATIVYLVLALSAILLVQPSAGFKLASENRAAQDVPILTETADGFTVQFGNNQPIAVSGLEDDCGAFSYPANGGSYGNNEHEVFLLNPSTRGPRQLVFSKFDIEANYDYVSIFVKNGNSFDLIFNSSFASYDVFTAPEGRALIIFKSDNSVTRTGFTLAYYKSAPQIEKDISALAHQFALEDAKAPVVSKTEAGFQVQIGDRTLTPVVLETDCGSFGSFSYPSDGGEYINYEDQLFLINSDDGAPRTITFPKFDLEYRYDVLTVYVYANNQFELVGRYHGDSRPSTIIAPNGRALLAFTSDYSITRSGFTALFYEH